MSDLLANIDSNIVADYQPKQMGYSEALNLLEPPPGYEETAEAKEFREKWEQDREAYRKEFLFNKEQSGLRRLKQKYEPLITAIIESVKTQERVVPVSTNENVEKE